MGEVVNLFSSETEEVFKLLLEKVRNGEVRSYAICCLCEEDGIIYHVNTPEYDLYRLLGLIEGIKSDLLKYHGD